MNKFCNFSNNISSFYSKKITINLSPPSGFRQRCEFGYYKNSYLMHENDNKKYLKSFNKAVKSIQILMPELLNIINNNFEIKEKLFQINFRSNNNDDVMVTLVYHKTINEDLIKIIKELSKDLKINILLRSKNFLYSTNSNYLTNFIDNKIKIYQTDNCFFQPNKFMLPKMISKVISLINKQKDLLELYCGVGTFTLPLSKVFTKILATENNRISIKCLNKALIENNINNISYSRLSSSEVSHLFEGKKFRRMGDIKITDYDFTHVIVDPPRSGLDFNTLNILKKFKNIIYISCNPKTYINDIKRLTSHYIDDIELFDQFPNSDHLEIISLLRVK
ncbi:MAG: tRNA (uridine(54)-C5)-methyltransferase TrmA [Gammaproteobacteria bacterium]|nr:tRNA (uridine(54)-C5)-methyltransferase TrmA [Gammaproteobacteria bacterium]